MHDIYRVCFDEDFVGDVLLAMTEKYKTIIKLTSFATLQTAKSIINNSRSDWLSKANTLVWAEPCARWAELKCLVFGQAVFQASPLVPVNTACYAGYAILNRDALWSIQGKEHYLQAALVGEIHHSID